jgi:hypothetical protein
MPVAETVIVRCITFSSAWDGETQNARAAAIVAMEAAAKCEPLRKPKSMGFPLLLSLPRLSLLRGKSKAKCGPEFLSCLGRA